MFRRSLSTAGLHLKYVCMTLEGRHVSAICVEIRGQIGRCFLPLTFTWVLRIEFKLTALCSNELYLLSHLTAPPIAGFNDS